MKLMSHLFLLAFVATIQADVAHALCSAPNNGVSGYKAALRSEIQAAHAIVVGRVVSINGLNEDRSDPEGVTAYNVTISVLRPPLKGRLPNVFSVRNENTSARYAMSVGEEHVLFISQGRDGQLWINSCGNSSLTAKDGSLVTQIQAELPR